MNILRGLLNTRFVHGGFCRAPMRFVRLQAQKFNLRARAYHGPTFLSHQEFLKRYELFQKGTLGHLNLYSEPEPVYELGVFANVELSLEKVGVYGFDFDYTLVEYRGAVLSLIYDLAVKALVERGYPSAIAEFKYDPKFAIRGLVFDVQNSTLLKLDYLENVEHVVRGRRDIPEDQVEKMYPSFHATGAERGTIGDDRNSKYRQLIDLYAMPEANLISDIVEYFEEHDIDFEPHSFNSDVMEVFDNVHATGLLHREIVSNLKDYVRPNPAIAEYLKRLREAGKKTFLLTNSAFPYVNTCMEYLVSENWREYFDVIVCSARKPLWFSSRQTPFSEIDEDGKTLWHKVTEFEAGKVYAKGNLKDFERMFGCENNVLYFGDNLSSDLVQPQRLAGWRTGLIIRELFMECTVQNSQEYREFLIHLMLCQRLIVECVALKGGNENVQEREQLDIALRKLKDMRHDIRKKLKSCYHRNLGSVFRGHHNQTLLSFRISSCVDVYTSRVENMAHFDLDHVFTPRRRFLPHERRVFQSV